MRAVRVRAAVVLGLALVLAAIWSATATAQLLNRCGTTASDRSLCGRVTVPLDRGGQVPGTVSLLVRALPPRHGAPSATMLALAGGPGQAATPLLDQIASALGPAITSRQLVTFDQRGTGGSGELFCPALRRPGSTVAIVGACAGELGPARVGYTTAESAADVEAVRAALGVEKLIVYGTSYGTKVALAYAAAYPQHVERLVLDSVVLPSGVDPFERTTLASIPRVLRALCAGNCRFTRNPVAELAALAHRLARRPLRGHALDSHGHPQRVEVESADLLAMLVVGDLDPELRASLPAAIHSALHGDPAPLLRLAGGGDARDFSHAAGDSDALFLATTCEDGGVPWPAGTPLQQRRAAVDAAAAAVPSRAFAPFDRATVRNFGIADLCRAWPESPIAQPQAPLPALPTLILSGDDDLRTPRSDATTLALRIPGARLLQVPDAGHSVLGADPTDCAERAIVAFLDGTIPGRCRAHPRALPTLPAPPRSIENVRALHGVPPQVGRTVGAVILTLGDVADQVIEQGISGSGAVRSFGGLRAGSASADPRSGVRLRGYAYLPGVTLTGMLPASSRAFTLTIGGKAAARGRLTISAKKISGTLGGTRVKLNPAKLGRQPLATTAAAAAGLTLRTPALGAWPLPALPRALR